MMFRNSVRSVVFTLCSVVSLVQADVTLSTNPDNGLRGWQFSSGDISIELIQRLPDQTRAMLMNHEFSPAVIEQMALSCMFQTVIRNTGSSGSLAPVSIDLTNWVMHHDNQPAGIVQKERLLASWGDADASPSAKLVVRWGMFPTQQEFQPTDYNWGLTAFGIAPGSTFDLDVMWGQNGHTNKGRIDGIVCAPDVDKLK